MANSFAKHMMLEGEASWDWLNKGDLKKETEGLITTAQDQALRTNAIKARIEKQDLSFAECAEPKMRQHITLFTSAVNWHRLNINNDTITGPELFTGTLPNFTDLMLLRSSMI